MKLVVAASSDLWPVQDLVSVIAALIGSLPKGSEVHLRGKDSLGRIDGVAPLERAAHLLAVRLGYHAQFAVPAWGPSRETIFKRDYDLVRGADRVVGFFMDEDPMGGGAGHVIHAAIQKGIPCEAWMWTDDGLVNLGADDGNISNLDPLDFHFIPAWSPPSIGVRGSASPF